MYQTIIGGAGALVLALIFGKLLIPVLRRLKFGQEIREEGPKWHAKKSGTPTMGGLIFIIAAIVMCAVCYTIGVLAGLDVPAGSEILMLLAVSVAFGVIGFIDDYIKVILKRNLGLTAKQKFLLQLIAAVAFMCWAVYGEGISTVVKIPFTEIKADFGMFFIPFAVFVILGTVNSVNLTDGLDGLATSITIIVALFFALFAHFGTFPNDAVALFAAILAGGLIGFLFYNKYPAKVFMGDTGSLFLGGAVCSMAILMEQPLALLIVGLVYVVETLSVILQVISFKTTGKRLFKMSPIHHHFEMCGWSERKIVAVFTSVTAVLCALMYFWG